MRRKGEVRKGWRRFRRTSGKQGGTREGKISVKRRKKIKKSDESKRTGT